MKNWLRNNRKVAVSVGIVLCLVGWWFSASVRGYVSAHWDVAQGHYEVQGFGLPAPWRKDYARLLRERYGIQYRAVAGCVVTGSLVSYVRAYNGVTTAAAVRKYQRDVFAECAADARKISEENAASRAVNSEELE